jgi:diguanylate cyclase (GGDEF)-like protein
LLKNWGYHFNTGEDQVRVEKQTILIVDDSSANIEILDGILSPEYEILFAMCGKDALDIAGEQIPDLILLDVVMPEMDGYEVCKQLKANLKTRDIPVIFITAMGQEGDESRGLDAGAIDYLTKPVRASIVKARVRNHLELKRYRDSLKTLSTIDGLTGIPNRRTFDETLDQEWRRSRRAQTTLSLLMMDIDCFKAYNDHYGHVAGDDCLRQIARGIAEAVQRPADLAARYGGEEFVALLPETDLAGAVVTAERVQHNINSLNIQHAYSKAAGHVTLSIGVATIIPNDRQSPLELIKSADEMLYEAKQKGRARIKSRILSPV